MSHATNTFVAPFPWEKIEAVARSELVAGKKMRDVVRRFVDARGVLGALDALLGVRTSAFLKWVRESTPAHVPENALGVLIAPADAVRVERAILVMVEPALAATLVARALGRPAPQFVVPNAAPTQELAGALAAVVRAVAARSHTGIAPVVLSAGSAGHLFLDVAQKGLAHTALFTLIVDDEAFTAAIVTDTRAIPMPEVRELTRSSLESMGVVPLALRIVAATCSATLDEVAKLAPGDVFLTGVPVPDALPGDARGLRPATYSGRVVLCGARAELGLVAELRHPEGLVLSAERVPMPLSAPDKDRERRSRGGRPPMDSNDIPTDVLADVDIVVRVELGAAELPASAWAKTRAGDVIALGRKVGEPVVLRVSGTEVAKGELVHVDGELGVRILSRTGEVFR